MAFVGRRAALAALLGKPRVGSLSVHPRGAPLLAALHSGARLQRPRVLNSTNAAASSSASSLAASSSLSPQLTVRNTAKAQGRLAVQLPLPGVAGLTRVALSDESKTVQDVLDAVKRADPTLKAVELTTPDGTKLARTVQLNELTAMPFCLRLNHVMVLVENGTVSSFRVSVETSF